MRVMSITKLTHHLRPSMAAAGPSVQGFAAVVTIITTGRRKRVVEEFSRVLPYEKHERRPPVFEIRPFLSSLPHAIAAAPDKIGSDTIGKNSR